MKEADEQFQTIDHRYRFGICCRIKIVLLVCKLRQILGSLKVVGFFGVSGAGKSSTIHQLGIKNVVGGESPQYRTQFPGLYRYPNQSDVFVLDTVGSQQIEIVGEAKATEMKRFRNDQVAISNIIVSLAPYKTEEGFSDDMVLKTRYKNNTDAMKVNGPYAFITCFNKIDFYVRSMASDIHHNKGNTLIYQTISDYNTERELFLILIL